MTEPLVVIVVYQSLSLRPEGGGVDDAPVDLDEVADLRQNPAEETSAEGELRDAWRDLEIAERGQSSSPLRGHSGLSCPEARGPALDPADVDCREDPSMSLSAIDTRTSRLALRTTRSLALAAVAALALAGCGSGIEEDPNAVTEPSSDSSVTSGENAADAEPVGDADPQQVIELMGESLQQPAVEACLDEMWGEGLLTFSAQHLNTTDAAEMGPVQLRPAAPTISGAQGFGCSFTTGVDPAEIRSGSTQVYTADDPAAPIAECESPVAAGEAVREDAEGVSEFVNSGSLGEGGSLITRTYLTCSEDASSMVVQTFGYEASDADAEPPYDTQELDGLITALAEDTAGDGDRREAWRDIALSEEGQ